MKRTPRLEYHLQTRVGSLSAGAPAPRCCLHEEKKCQGHSQAPHVEMAKVMAPSTPHLDPFRVHGCINTEDFQADLLGECVVAPSVLPHWWHEECIKELHEELAKCMARACLQNEPRPARPTARSGRCSHNSSTSQVCSLSAGLRESQPSDQEKTTWQDERGQESDVPGVGTGWGDARAPHPNNQAGTSHPSLAPHDHILLMSGSAAPSRIFTYTQGHMNLRAGHGKMMPPEPLKSILHKNL